MADNTEQMIRELSAKIDRLWDHLDEELRKLRSFSQS